MLFDLLLIAYMFKGGIRKLLFLFAIAEVEGELVDGLLIRDSVRSYWVCSKEESYVSSIFCNSHVAARESAYNYCLS